MTESVQTLDLNHVAEFVPHSGKMVLLDKILQYDHQSLSALAYVNEQHIFVQDRQFPSWAAMELMAQGVAAWAGCLGKEQGEPVRLGFLLGTRKLVLNFDCLTVPVTLYVKIQMSIQDNNGFGVFDTSLWLCDEHQQPQQCLAQAALNVFSPKELPGNHHAK